VATKTYYYQVSGDASVELPVLLASGASPVVSLPALDNPFLAVTLDDTNKDDLDAAMASLGFAFVAEGVGKQRSATNADSPYTPGEELIILADATAGPINITMQALSTFLTTIRQIKVVKVDATANAVNFVPLFPDTVNGLASYSLTSQYEAAEFFSGPSQWHLMLQPSAPTPLPQLTVTTTDALTAGDLVAYDNNNPAQTVLADPDISLSPSRYDAKGIATATALASAVTTIYSIPGQRVPVRFAPPPAALSNGSRVYLSSTPGLATLTAPGSGYALVLVGILVGADGATSTPDVVFEFDVIAIIP